MRIIPVTNTAIDLSLTATRLPFKPQTTVGIVNFTAGSLILQDSPDNSSFSTLATVAAGAMQEVTLRNQYIKVSTVATMYLFSN
jgi:hypothetical protein